ncbi:hypothetical protein PF002_g7994 [Phytophthora fragariae]|uniref:Uncharacterized protein n=2 Tax=Phytophthora fragariae TaxID=53985 RepID=A0A6A4A0V8_9STRA|nr:hypothetical protein PF007_g6707 [Phytophthora fragariae]KAE9244023.1 hypothetical protein PF002_g7994 [Phytophthora fragariae]KAE9323022.1 hypothetical protein PF001_g4122 [Phytophthora fragariae]
MLHLPDSLLRHVVAVLRKVYEGTCHIPRRAGLCMKPFVVAARADQGSDRLLVLEQELSVGADESVRGGCGSL